MKLEKMKDGVREDFLTSYKRFKDVRKALESVDLKRFEPYCYGEHTLRAELRCDEEGLNLVIYRITKLKEKKEPLTVILLVVPIITEERVVKTA